MPCLRECPNEQILDSSNTFICAVDHRSSFKYSCDDTFEEH